MKKDSKDYESSTEFDKEYGVIQWNRSITPTGGRSNPVPPHACCPVAQRNRRWNLHLRLFKQAALAVPKATEIIDLRGIHMEADARRSILTLTATNQEIAIQASMSAVVEQAGSIVIDAKLLPSLLSRLPEETRIAGGRPNC